MTALVIARTSLLRLVRDRTALFFLVILPLVVILIAGASLRGFSTLRVGVVDLGAGAAGRQVASALADAPDLTVVRYPSVRSMSTAIARAEVSAGIVLPAGMDRAQRGGEPVALDLLVEQANSSSQAAATAVDAAVTAQGVRVQAAQFATGQAGGTYAGNLARATALEPRVPRVQVDTVDAQPTSNVLPEGFSYSAPTELVLFVFLSAIAAGAAIVETRHLGLYERMSAAPVRARSIIGGEALNYLVIALGQSLLIVVVGALAFGVSWGDPIAAGLLIIAWSLVGAGAGMLSGTLFKTPEQASAIGPVVGIAFGMLGGCMWPLSIVSPIMRQLGHATPHAWAIDAWTELLARGGNVSAVVADLGVILSFAVAFLVLATVRLHRSIS